jgi:ABC-type transport system substrate-binding protein
MSGPFKLEEFIDSSRVVLVRNEYFSPVWGFNSYLDKVVFQLNDPDPLASYARGQQDIVNAYADSVGEAAYKVPDTLAADAP